MGIGGWCGRERCACYDRANNTMLGFAALTTNLRARRQQSVGDLRKPRPALPARQIRRPHRQLHPRTAADSPPPRSAESSRTSAGRWSSRRHRPSARARHRRRAATAAATIQRAPLSLSCSPNQPLTWIELTVACMPSACITRTTSAICCGGQVRELAVVDGDVGDAPGAVARQRRARHFAQHPLGGAAAGAACWRARVASSCAYSTASPSPSRNSATAPFSATIASIGQSRAKRLAPAHRPAGDRDDRHAGVVQRGERLQRLRHHRAVGRQRVVDVGQHAAHRAQPLGRACGKRDRHGEQSVTAIRGGPSTVGDRRRAPGGPRVMN